MRQYMIGQGSLRLNAKLLKASAQTFHLTPPIVRDSSEVLRALTRGCYPHTGKGGLSWCLSTSPSWSVARSYGCHALRATLNGRYSHEKKIEEAI